MASDEDSEEEKVDTGKDLFKKQAKNRHFGYGSEDDDYDSEDGSESEESEDHHEQNVFNNQNAFGMNVFGNTGGRAPMKRTAMKKGFGGFGGFG